MVEPDSTLTYTDYKPQKSKTGELLNQLWTKYDYLV